MARPRLLIVRSQRRPRPAYIPANYQRTADSDYEHSRSSPVSAAVLITLAVWFSGGAILYAAVKTGWTTRLTPPKQGVNSILLSASIATQLAARPEPTTVMILIPETRDSVEPLGVGSLDAQLRPISVSGRETPLGAPAADNPIEHPVSSLAANRKFVRAETDQQPLMQAEPPRLKRNVAPTGAEATARKSVPLSKQLRGVRSKAPRPLHNPPPVYPAALLAAEVEGRVTVKASVRGDGKVAGVVMFRSSGYPAFDQAALVAVAEWRFDADPNVPAASSMSINVPLRFSIERP